jgi:hypothetical protein
MDDLEAGIASMVMAMEVAFRLFSLGQTRWL